MVAAKENYLKIKEIMTKAPEIDINFMDGGGESALIIPFKCQHLTAVQEIFKWSPSAVHCDVSGNTSMHWAVIMGDLQI